MNYPGTLFLLEYDSVFCKMFETNLSLRKRWLLKSNLVQIYLKVEPVI